MDLLIAEMRELRMETTNLRRGQEELLQVSRCQFRRVDQVASRVDTFLEYSTDFNSTLSNMFNTLGVSLGLGPFHFPTPPIFSEYMLDTEVEDKEEDAWYLREVLLFLILPIYFDIEDNICFKFGGKLVLEMV